jgi:hypothetical protein
MVQHSTKNICADEFVRVLQNGMFDSLDDVHKKQTDLCCQTSKFAYKNAVRDTYISVVNAHSFELYNTSHC